VEAVPVYGDRSREPAVLIFDEDPELAEALPVTDQAAARRLLWAPLITAEKGAWRPPDEPQGMSLGLLVLDGALTRTISVDSGSACELLGSGDLIRPWDEDKPTDMGPVPVIEWKVLEPVRIARLDARLTALLARWPQLMVALSRRSLRRSRTLSYLLAVSHGVRVEEKLLVALWHIADGWGRVTPRGVLLRLPLTHEMLGQIIGAKRPSVWAALKVLHERGLVHRVKEGYLLLGDPDARASDPLEHGHAPSAEDLGEAGVGGERALFAS
jgi:CRP/FNR family cyclic AMP-dependent transcriptional regulator